MGIAGKPAKSGLPFFRIKSSCSFPGAIWYNIPSRKNNAKEVLSMKHLFRLCRMLIPILLACCLALTGAASAEETLVVNPEAEPLSREDMLSMVKEATDAFYHDEELLNELQSEVTVAEEEIPLTEEDGSIKAPVLTLTHGGKAMRCFMMFLGDSGEGEGPWPLYLTLHGGGGAEPEFNNSQWLSMADYYADSGISGLYVACRGITDTWDLHFQEDTYPLLDRLIGAMVLLYGADPDRVYLLGFSAGGDGVYQLSPRLADRFAAVNMSSGHPNGVSLLNLANCPICLQAGIRDFYSDTALRSVRAAEFDKTLSDYHDKYGFGYRHRVFIHVPAGHNYVDYQDCESTVLKDPSAFAARAEDPDFLERFLDIAEQNGLARDVPTLSYTLDGTNPGFDRDCKDLVTEDFGLETETANTSATAYVSQFTRDPAPVNLVWDLSTRAQKREKNSFYWLEAAPEVNQGVITASYDPQTNTITVEPDAGVNGDFAILFHPALVDVSLPVTVRTGDITRTVRVNPSREFLEASMRETGDPEMACVGKILYSRILHPEN